MFYRIELAIWLINGRCSWGTEWAHIDQVRPILNGSELDIGLIKIFNINSAFNISLNQYAS